MAKKQPRSGKPVPGGRVTPKGVRPDTPSGRKGNGSTPAADAPRAQPPPVDQGHGRQFTGQPGPTRAGHHRGQR
jgi:hypothetical protein